MNVKHPAFVGRLDTDNNNSEKSITAICDSVICVADLAGVGVTKPIFYVMLFSLISKITKNTRYVYQWNVAFDFDTWKFSYGGLRIKYERYVRDLSIL